MIQDLEAYFDRLWPIHRSLTGEGNRDTLRILSELVDMKVEEVPSGTACFDWIVPPEWNVREAWIKDSSGKKIIDFAENNLHLLGYSAAVHARLTFDELREHLYTLPEQPDLIPYLTSYYKKRWGFCLSHFQLESLDKNAEYEVYIDSDHNEEGTMTIGEAYIEGSSKKEILFSTYICHPSLANNELSGPLVLSFLFKILKNRPKPNYSYRFLFIPETIGSIYSLSKYGEFWKEHLKAGFVVTCVGDDGNFTYKRSRRANSEADRAAETMLKQSGEVFEVIDFFPHGSDERQYCSPGFNLPVGSLMRTMYGKYAAYHTSADNKSLISFEAMERTIERYVDMIELIEANKKYLNTMPYCEPQLGKRGLYPTLGSQKASEEFVKIMMWILNLSDGEHDLIAISERSGVEVKKLLPVVERLLESGILREC